MEKKRTINKHLTESELEQVQSIRTYLFFLLNTIYDNAKKEIVTSDDLSDFRRMLRRAEYEVGDVCQDIQFLEGGIHRRQFREWNEGKQWGE